MLGRLSNYIRRSGAVTPTMSPQVDILLNSDSTGEDPEGSVQVLAVQTSALHISCKLAFNRYHNKLSPCHTDYYIKVYRKFIVNSSIWECSIPTLRVINLGLKILIPQTPFCVSNNYFWVRTVFVISLHKLPFKKSEVSKIFLLKKWMLLCECKDALNWSKLKSKYKYNVTKIKIIK